jgi:hypothetical protein
MQSTQKKNNPFIALHHPLLCGIDTETSQYSYSFIVNYPSNAVYLEWAAIGNLFWWAVAGAVILLNRGW